MRKILSYTVASLLAIAFCSLTAMAQSEATTGRIAGTVKDAQGAAVPGASVVVSNPATGFSINLTTNDSGEFTAVQLKPGDYTIEVTATGFGKATQTGYKVEVGSELTANIALGVQSVNEEVLVTAASVETTQVQTTTNMNDKAIEGLPINGRRFQDFVLATPTAQIDPQRGQISLVGQRGINGNVQIDGADYNNPFFGGLRGGERSNQAFTIPQGAVREFQVVASGYNAEFGRSTGGVVNVVTKSGTNDFHGGLFYVVRPQSWAHKNAFSQIAAPTQKQFGGSVGGPLPLPRFGEGGRSSFGGKDKSFFFVAYEEQRLKQERAVLMNNLRLPGTNTPISGSGIDEAMNFSLGTEGPYGQTNNAKVFLMRFDFNLNQQNQVNFRYNNSQNTALNAVTAGTSLTPTTNSALSNNGTEGDDTDTFVGQWTSFFTSTTVNEFRAQYTHENRPRLANELSPELRMNYGIFGTVNFLPTTESDYRVQLTDNLTLIKGSHTIKLGGEYNYSKASQVFAFRQFGSFSFSFSGTAEADVRSILRIMSVGGNTTTQNANGNTTGTILDPTNRFDDNRVRYGRQIGNGLLTLAGPQYAGFIQDSWRVKSNLTLNFGLRYEAQMMPAPDTSNTALTNAVVGTNLPLGNIDPREIADQTNQWAPRGGFAWDPWSDGKGVIRGYTGIYYAATPLLTLAAPLNNFRTPPGDVTFNLPTTCPTGSLNPAGFNSLNTVWKQFNSIGINLNNFPLNALPILSIAQVQQINANVAAACNGTFNSLAGLQVVAATKDLRNPRSFQMGIGVEREIARGLTVGANFDYVKTTRLTFNRDYDLPAPIIRTGDFSQRPFFGVVSSTVIGAQNRPISLLGNSGYVQVRDSSARSKYQAFSVRAQLRRKFGQFDAFYVLSKNQDSDSTERNATFATYENAFNLAPEYNYGALDRRHVISANAVLQAPWGFEVAVNSRFLSAAPIDVSVSSILAPAGSGLTNQQYANLVTLQQSTTGDLNQDTTFPDRPFVAPGVSSLRNSYRNKPLKFVDLRIQRNFRWGEKYELAPSLEIFNLFDFHNITLASTTILNYGNPGINERTGEVLAPSNPLFFRTRDDNGNFLLQNSPGSPMQFQVGVRFKF